LPVRSSWRAQQPELLSEISAAKYAIAVLVGLFPEDLDAELSRTGNLPAVLPSIDPGLPLQLLRQRPDIREAERHLAAATVRIGVATANLFPHLALSGATGTQSASIGLQGGHIWSAGPSLYWPLLDFGALDAQVSVADLKAREQLIAYRRTVMAAVQDADGAVSDYDAQRQRLLELQGALVSSRRAVTLAQQRYDRGLTDYLNVVDAEREQYRIEDSYSTARQSAADAFVNLCQALGGDWKSYQDLPPIKRPEPAVVAAVHRLMSGAHPSVP